MNEKLSTKIVVWPGKLDQLPEQVWTPTIDRLIIVAIPGQQLPHLSCHSLNPAQFVRFAETLIAVVGIPDYTPTTVEPTPLRLDSMLDQLLSQPPDFLLPLLRNWCEWFGLHPLSTLAQTWIDFARHHTGYPDNVSSLVNDLIDRNLACADDESIYLPLAVAVTLAQNTQLPGWDTLPDLVHELRYALLQDTRFGPTCRSYQQVTAFLRNPRPSLDGHLHRTTRARGNLVDLLQYDFSSDASQPAIDAVLVGLQYLYQSDRARYREVFNQVQGPVWESLGQAVSQLDAVKSSMSGKSLTVDRSSYINSCRSVSRELRLISEAYTVLTMLETKLGIDRYLGGRALARDLSLVHERVRRVAQDVHRLLDESRQVYLRQWNLTNIGSIVLHLLDLIDKRGQLTSYFPNDQHRVIFLLVDALGYTQLQWFLNTVAQKAAAPLASNVFAWLREQGAFNNDYLLASNLVSVTGGCLPTIYTGVLPSETGVIGSHMMMEGHRLNVLAGADEHHKLSRSEVDEVYRRNANLNLIPFAQHAHDSGVSVRIFHGGSMGFKPLTDLTYGKLRKQGLVTRVRQADRIFAEALPDVLAWENKPQQKHLALLYYPLIDHSGHGCGPYTQFQTAELGKLNFVFAHFLVDMARQAEELFDGRTSVLVSADHGMFESASTAVSHRTVRHALGGKSECRNMSFIYDNRSMYIYGVDASSIEAVRRDLTEYFSANKLYINVSTRSDPLVRDLLCGPNSPCEENCPDVILQFYGPGVFYYDEDLPSHMFLYGAHGGINVEETFVPLMHFTLTPSLATSLKQFF